MGHATSPTMRDFPSINHPNSLGSLSHYASPDTLIDLLYLFASTITIKYLEKAGNVIRNDIYRSSRGTFFPAHRPLVTLMLSIQPLTAK